MRLENFVYDALHRMITAERSGGQVAVNYAYAPVGNLQSKSDFGSSYPYSDPLHKHGVKAVSLAAGGTANYDFDANGNVVKRGKNSQLTDSFGFDIDNRPQFSSASSDVKGGLNRVDFYLSATGAKALKILASRTIICAGS